MVFSTAASTPPRTKSSTKASDSANAESPRAARALASISATAVASAEMRAASESAATPSSSANAAAIRSTSGRTWRRSSAQSSGSRAIAACRRRAKSTPSGVRARTVALAISSCSSGSARAHWPIAAITGSPGPREASRAPSRRIASP